MVKPILEDPKKESYASKVEPGTTKPELESARKELKWTRETLEGAKIQRDATNAGMDWIATTLRGSRRSCTPSERHGKFSKRNLRQYAKR